MRTLTFLWTKELKGGMQLITLHRNTSCFIANCGQRINQLSSPLSITLVTAIVSILITTIV